MGLFNILWWYEKNIKALLLHMTIVVKKNHFEMWTALSIFIHGPHSYLKEWWTDQLGIQSYILDDTVLKINGVCGFKENNW